MVCFSLSALAEVERFVLLFSINNQNESMTVKVKYPPKTVEIGSQEPSPYIGLTNELMLSAEYEAADGWALIFTNIDDAYFDGFLVISGLNQPMLIPPKGGYRLPVGMEGEGMIEGYSNQPPMGLGSDMADQEFLPEKEVYSEEVSSEDRY